MPQLAPPPPRLQLPPAASLDPFAHAAPPAPPQQPSPPVRPPSPARSPRSSRRWVGLLVLAAAALTGIGGALAWYVSSRPPRPTPPPPPTPQQLLDQAIAAWSQVKSFHGEFSFTLTIVGNEGSELGQSLVQSGYLDRQVTFTVAVTQDVALSPTPQGSGSLSLRFPLPQSIPLLGGAELSAKASFIQLDSNTTFIRFDELPPIPFLPLEPLRNQWVKLDLKAIQEQLPISVAAPSPSAQLPDVAKLQARWAELYRQHAFLEATGAEPGEPMGDVPTTKITATFNRERFKAFFQRAWDELIIPAAAGSSAVLTTEALAELDKVLETFQLNATVWAGQADHVIRQANVTALFTPTDKGAPQGSVTVTANTKISQLNQPVTVTQPDQYVPLEQVLQQLQPSMPKSLELPAEPGLPLDADGGAGGDTDGDKLPDAAERLFGTDPSNPDTDGDGYPDGTEVENGYNPAGPGKLEATPEVQP